MLCLPPYKKKIRQELMLIIECFDPQGPHLQRVDIVNNNNTSSS